MLASSELLERGVSSNLVSLATETVMFKLSLDQLYLVEHCQSCIDPSRHRYVISEIPQLLLESVDCSSISDPSMLHINNKISSIGADYLFWKF
jgi:hypothetical protein